MFLTQVLISRAVVQRRITGIAQRRGKLEDYSHRRNEIRRACRKTGSTCTDCVKTPITDPADATKGLGYSSYFALDITDQNTPKLLWSGTARCRTLRPASMKTISGFDFRACAGKNKRAHNQRQRERGGQKQKRKVFVVLGSGPTGPVGSGQQFMGKSDQPGRLFFIDLKNGPTTGNFWSIPVR